MVVEPFAEMEMERERDGWFSLRCCELDMHIQVRLKDKVGD